LKFVKIHKGPSVVLKSQRNGVQLRKKTTPKNVSISYDKDGTMKIGGRKCDRLTKPVLLDVAKKLGVVGVRQKKY